MKRYKIRVDLRNVLTVDQEPEEGDNRAGNNNEDDDVDTPREPS